MSIEKIKVWKIDPDKKEISLIEINTEYRASYKDIRKHVNNPINAAIEHSNGEDNILYINEKGMENAFSHINLEELSEEEQKKLEVNGFKWQGNTYIPIIIGTGMVEGIDFIEESIDTTIPYEDMLEFVHFRTFTKEEIDIQLNLKNENK